MNHIKKGSAHTPLSIADKFDTYETALKNTLLNKFTIETLNNKLQEVTLQDGSKEINFLPGTIVDYASFDTIPESKILDAGDLLILSNLQKPWTIACKDVSRVFEIEYSTYRILNRSEQCECSLTAGNYLLSYTNINCGMHQKQETATSLHTIHSTR